MVVIVPLTNGYVSLIDDADSALISQWTWRAHKTRNGRIYAVHHVHDNGKRTTILMHRMVLGLPPGRNPKVDHIDGDSLNNCRTNLRPVTHAQNMQNRRGATKNSATGVRGVYFDKRDQVYRAQVRVNGQFVLRKSFATLEDADRAARVARATYMTHAAESPAGDRATVRAVLGAIHQAGYLIVPNMTVPV